MPERWVEYDTEKLKIMLFHIFCTNCGQKLEAEDEHIGHEMPCPVCNEPIHITKPRPLQVSNPKAEKNELREENNTSGKLNELRNKAKSTIENISNSDQATELKENLKDLRKRGQEAAVSAADTLSKSAKIGGLQAKIKKLETIDLRKALQELGENCFVGNTIQRAEPELYADLEKIKSEIDESNDKGLPEMATLGGKEQVKRLALRAQLKIKEEQLKSKYRENLILLGERGFNSEEARQSFKDLIEYIISLKLQIKEARESIDSLGKEVHHFFKNPWMLICFSVMIVAVATLTVSYIKPNERRVNASSSSINISNPTKEIRLYYRYPQCGAKLGGFNDLNATNKKRVSDISINAYNRTCGRMCRESFHEDTANIIVNDSLKTLRQMRQYFPNELSGDPEKDYLYMLEEQIKDTLLAIKQEDGMDPHKSIEKHIKEWVISP